MSPETDTASLTERFRKAYENFGKGDLEAIRADFAPDIVWHAGGNNILTGDYKGTDAVFGLFGKVFTETGGTLKQEVHDILTNESHGVALIKGSAERNGKKLEGDTVHVVHYNAEGLVTESWFIPVDAAATDAFWS